MTRPPPRFWPVIVLVLLAVTFVALQSLRHVVGDEVVNKAEAVGAVVYLAFVRPTTWGDQVWYALIAATAVGLVVTM